MARGTIRRGRSSDPGMEPVNESDDAAVTFAEAEDAASSELPSVQPHDIESVTTERLGGQWISLGGGRYARPVSAPEAE